MRLCVCILLILNITIAICDYTEETSGSSNEKKLENRVNERNLSTAKECARACVRGAKPKTCYYHFTVEYFSTLTNACNLCRSNATTGLTADCQCIMSDGYELSGLITANRMHPGPSIMVCKGDYVVIDVANHVPGNAVTLHWHGMHQRGHQYYDGVPFVTQCPIAEGTTFRYQWEAQNSGTHFWHAHTGLQKGDGLEGPLIVREPKWDEPDHDLWDFDNLDNVIFLSDLFHDNAADHYPGNNHRRPGQLPDNFLINGKGQWTDPVSNTTTNTSLAVFTVKAGHRYRFRMINSCALTCALILTIQSHELTVIATDGEPVEPVPVTSITSSSAERYDFVVTTDKRPGSYWIQARGLGGCASKKSQQVAILRYESAPDEPEFNRPTYDRPLAPGKILNPFNVRCDDSSNVTNVVCVSQLNSVKPVPEEILKPRPDIKLYVPIGFYSYPDEELFEPGVYRRYLDASGHGQTAAMLGNIMNMFPPSPLISQLKDIPDNQFCSHANVPEKCMKINPCECTHVEEIPLNSVVELIFVDEGGFSGLSHPMHLHGYAYYIMGRGFGDQYNISNIDVSKVKELDNKGLIKRRWSKPPAKDTFAVPYKGFMVVRFLADNPGYWLMHCHFLFHLVGGMSLIFHVGQADDLPPVPRGFPKCGNYRPPIYSH